MTLPQPTADLYEILGAARDATAAQIKSAYRAASKKSHPDMDGGSAAAFAKVQHAWNILGDTERRARYDATGDATEQQPDNSAARVHTYIMGAFDRAMQVDDVDYRDIVGAAIKLLEQDRQGGEAANQQLRDVRSKLKKVRKRLKFKGDGIDLIDRTLKDRLGELERNIAGNKATMEQVAEAIERLRGGWTYEVEAAPQWSPMSGERAMFDAHRSTT